jgi:hypothetical protein
MKLKDLEKATKIYEEIKLLDVDIAKLDKLAQSVAYGCSEVKLYFNVTDLKAKESFEKSNLFDEHGDLKQVTTKVSLSDKFITYSGESYDDLMAKIKSINNAVASYSSNYVEDLSDVLTLEMLGVLIRNKQDKRKLLIDKLTKYKITI